MRKIEKRAVICMALAILLAAGMSVFLIKYFAEGGKWASSAFNRHLYDSNGVLISGTVLDRDGDVLSSVENGTAPTMKTKPSARPPSTRWETCTARSAPAFSTPSRTN